MRPTLENFRKSKNLNKVENKLKEGASKAREIAKQTIKEVKNCIFKTNELI